jgi:O-6-methylguanine DNA methyltransferase
MRKDKGVEPMSLMISGTASPLTPAATDAKATAETILYATRECALGQLLAARSAAGVCAILLGSTGHELRADLSARFPRAILIADEAALRGDLANVVRFIDKPADGLHLPLDMRGTPFQRRVWRRLRAIPAGRTVSYKELARAISPLVSPRAAARACAANPIALAVPCHRVIRSNGALAGYRWGAERKRELIRKEAMA